MGIRFNCSHCQRTLNVKTAQAGLEGICPHCQNVVKIVSDLSGADGEDYQLREEEQVTQVSLESVIRQASNSSLTELSLPAAKPRRSEQSSEPFGNVPEKDAFTLDKPASPFYFCKEDPIADAPHLIWYYRNKETGERGPFKSKVMLNEIAAGKVTTESVVWREDWDEWMPAEKIFSELMLQAAHGKTNATTAGLVNRKSRSACGKRVSSPVFLNSKIWIVISISVLLIGIVIGTLILLITLFGWRI